MLISTPPRSLFNLTNREISPDNTVKLLYSPKATNVNGLESAHGQRTIDDFILIALTKMIKPNNFFEFGTDYGVTLLNLAMNFPELEFYSIDIEKFKQVYSNTNYETRIHNYIADSVNFDYSMFYGKMDIVLVDGGRDDKTIRADTENAFKMLSDNFSCIVWHDYPTIPKVKEFIDEISMQHTIYHIQDSLICFYLNNAPENISKSLNS